MDNKEIKTEVKGKVDIVTRTGLTIAIISAVIIAGGIALALFYPGAGNQNSSALLNLDIPGARPGFPVNAAFTNSAQPNLIGLKNTNASTGFDYGGLVAATKQEYDFNGSPTKTEISIIKPDGTILAGWPKTTDEPVYFEPAVGDILGAGAQNVVVTSGNYGLGPAKVYVWGTNGDSLSNFPVNLGDDVLPLGPVLSDLDGDHNLEIIVAANANNINSKAKLFVYKSDGTLMLGWPQTFDSYAFADTPAVGDVDGDGQNEIVIGTFGKIYAIRKDGTMLPNWPVTLPNNNTMQQHSPILADFNGDGKLEVVATFADSSGNWNIGIWSSSGSIIKQWPLDGYVTDFLVGDFNNDKKIEIIVLTPTKINIFDSNGASLPNWPQVLPAGETPERAILVNFMSAGSMTYSNKLVVSVDVATKLIPIVTKIYAFKPDGSVHPGWPITLKEVNSSVPLLGQIDYTSASMPSDPDLFIKIGGDSVAGSHLYGWGLLGIYNAKTQLWPIDKHDPQNTKLYNRCSDSTIFGECNANKKYCANGALVDKCQVCGCPANYTCQSSGACQQCPYDKRLGQYVCTPNATQ